LIKYDALEKFSCFHDWYLDIIAIGPNREPRTLTLGLYLESERATVTFEGVTCFRLENLGLLNIIFKILLLQPGDQDYPKALKVLEQGERLDNRKAAHVAYMYSTLGAQLAIEFDSLSIGHEDRPTS
jgi:hypothetical protein